MRRELPPGAGPLRTLALSSLLNAAGTSFTITTLGEGVSTAAYVVVSSLAAYLAVTVVDVALARSGSRCGSRGTRRRPRRSSA